MKNTYLLKHTIFFLLIVALFSSCNVNNGLFQKRKYTKGYHLSLNKKVAKNSNTTTTAIEKPMQSEVLTTEVVVNEINYTNTPIPDSTKTKPYKKSAIKNASTAQTKRTITPLAKATKMIKEKIETPIKKVLNRNILSSSNITNNKLFGWHPYVWIAIIGLTIHLGGVIIVGLILEGSWGGIFVFAVIYLLYMIWIALWGKFSKKSKEIKKKKQEKKQKLIEEIGEEEYKKRQLKRNLLIIGGTAFLYLIQTLLNR